MSEATHANLIEAHKAILAEAEEHAITRAQRDAEPVAPKPNAYKPLTDYEWSLCEPFLRLAPQSILIPRLALDGVLSHFTDGVPWGAIWGGLGSRQMYVRRLRSGHIAAMLDAVLPRVSDERRLQFQRLVKCTFRPN